MITEEYYQDKGYDILFIQMMKATGYVTMLDYYLMKLHAFVPLQANRLDDCFTLTIHNMLSDYIDVCGCLQHTKAS